LDILSATLRIPKGCRLFLFQILHSEKKIFSRYFGNRRDLNSPFLRFKGKILRSTLFERALFSKKTSISRKKDHKYFGVVLLALTSQKSDALFHFPTSKRASLPNPSPGRSISGCSGLFFAYRRTTK